MRSKEEWTAPAWRKYCPDGRMPLALALGADVKDEDAKESVGLGYGFDVNEGCGYCYMPGMELEERMLDAERVLLLLGLFGGDVE